MRSNALVALAALVLTITAACTGSSERVRPIGEAYVAPLALNLRLEVTPGSKTVGTASHGDRVDILQTRRRFVRVRTPKGVEGWTEQRHLLTTEQMAVIRRFAEQAAKLPSQGAATVFSTLNIHSEPSRSSPSIYQINEGALVDVLAHKIAPRTAQPAMPQQPLVKPPPPPVRKKKKKDEEGRLVLPKPAAPKPPTNWVELSKTVEPEPVAPPPPKEPENTKPVPQDDWSLVRTQNGKAGWVLSRMLTMAIPDEVAQYAEGDRITSYFRMADVRDGDQVKHYWLWTTINSGSYPYDFDSFRFFIWNVKKHRYETAYIERNVIGYYPIEAKAGSSGSPPSFTLIVEDEDGSVWRKSYIYDIYRVRLVGTEPAKRPVPPTLVAHIGAEPSPDKETDDGKPSWTERLKGLFKRSGS